MFITQITLRVIILSITFLLVAFQGYTQAVSKDTSPKTFKRFFQLNDSVYRSEQPNKKEFKTLEAYGVKTVLNLRRLKADDKKAKHTELHLEKLSLKSAEMTEKHIIEALRILKDAEKPVLIHCWHGSDRTGIISAAYRIVVENWSKDKAIAEFRKPVFGYHENWYPNLIALLEQLNVAEIRQTLGL